MDRVVGRIGRANGIRGDLNVDIRTDEPERRFALGSSVFAGDRMLTIRSARHHGGKMVIGFKGIGDRNAAEALQGLVLMARVDPDDRPDDSEEFYDHQLIGLAARTPAGAAVGVVKDVLHLPAQDTLVIDRDGREILVPFVSDIVSDVSIDVGYLVVEDVPGLLNPDEAESTDRP